ncbi:hypothetical protein FEM48_Zijuj12G0053800 [Ziziphus jujuba var. spinosa]|uniref:Cytochrome P450 76A1-like n=1 Tax=Ziziphus jujuba var. spinosa TaxID=714518 RepID=A0A978UBE9_ZIZJJ|nr:hypothetical protein FEM48_Zijuj12G0053800 [Ziziphus jujuba var. spinosa]
MNTMVVQSAKTAEQLFKNHDASSCDRKCPHALTAHNYDEGTIAFGQHGSHYWRVLWRLCSMEIFSNKRIDDTALIRHKCVDDMIRYMEEDSAAARGRGEPGAVNLAHYLFLMGFNVIGNLVFSKDLLDPNCGEGKEFFDAVDKIMEFMGKPNVADFLPFLKWLDLQGIKRNMTKHMAKALKIGERFVEERVEEYKLGSQRLRLTKDFLDVMLEYESDGKEGPLKISHQNINIVVLEMFMAGSESTSTTVEWAMTELFRNPESMQKVKEELNRVIGRKRKVEESDMDNLPYLQAVVKETMRDPESWDDPLFFKPERYIGSNVDYKGQNFELLPFGSGRRICLGIPLAHRVIHLALAALLHTFDWEFDAQALDMSERVGITLRRSIPLQAIPKKRN